jgi:hypothetical protein
MIKEIVIMPDSILSQSEADNLIKVPKIKSEETLYSFPIPGRGVKLPLTSTDRREEFEISVYRGGIDLSKCSYNTLSRHKVVLVRVDLFDHGHRNPDGHLIEGPHIHLYREGFGDKWAKSLPLDIFTDPRDLFLTLENFFFYCNVIDPPNIQRGAF